MGDGNDYVRINGHDVHVIGYLQGFLFSARRAMTPVKSLSGGERNRVILARLFTRPTNLLMLDEPTNDLDVETLEVLEDQLEEYKGTLLVVSHDRMFVDNVVTSTLAFETGGVVRRYPGGYSDWMRQGGELAVAEDEPAAACPTPERPSRCPRGAAPSRPRLLLQGAARTGSAPAAHRGAGAGTGGTGAAGGGGAFLYPALGSHRTGSGAAEGAAGRA